MNYNETYFELDSEEVTHCHLICCVYIKGYVETVNIKDQSNAIMYAMLFVDTVNTKIKACNALRYVCYVVCQHCRYWCLWLLHNTVYRVMKYKNSTLLCIKLPLAPPMGKGILKAFHLVGLAVYQSIQGGSFVNFLGLVSYKGDCRQNPQFLELRGHSATQ